MPLFVRECEHRHPACGSVRANNSAALVIPGAVFSDRQSLGRERCWPRQQARQGWRGRRKTSARTASSHRSPRSLQFQARARPAFFLAASHDAMARQRSMRFRDDRALSLGRGIIVIIDNHPIRSPTEFVRKADIGKERRELPFVSSDVQDRKPSLAIWIETLGRDLAQLSRTRPFPILAVDVKQQENRRAAICSV